VARTGTATRAPKPPHDRDCSGGCSDHRFPADPRQVGPRSDKQQRENHEDHPDRAGGAGSGEQQPGACDSCVPPPWQWGVVTQAQQPGRQADSGADLDAAVGDLGCGEQHDRSQDEGHADKSDKASGAVTPAPQQAHGQAQQREARDRVPGPRQPHRAVEPEPQALGHPDADRGRDVGERRVRPDVRDLRPGRQRTVESRQRGDATASVGEPESVAPRVLLGDAEHPSRPRDPLELVGTPELGGVRDDAHGGAKDLPVRQSGCTVEVRGLVACQPDRVGHRESRQQQRIRRDGEPYDRDAGSRMCVRPTITGRCVGAACPLVLIRSRGDGSHLRHP